MPRFRRKRNPVEDWSLRHHCVILCCACRSASVGWVDGRRRFRDGKLGAALVDRGWIRSGARRYLRGRVYRTADERGAGRRRRRCGALVGVRDDMGAARQSSRTRSWCGPPRRSNCAPRSSPHARWRRARRWPVSTRWPARTSTRPARRRCSLRRQRWPPPSPMWRRGLSCFRTWPPMSDTAAAISTAHWCRCGIRSRPIAYGFVAHALAVRDGCTSQNCKALDVLADAEPRARQFERTNARSLSRSLFDRLGAAARWPGAGRRRCAAEPADVPAGRAGPAQDGQHRLPHRGIDPAGQHHESGARHQSHAGSAGGVCGQSKSAGASRCDRIGAAAKKSRKQAANPPAQAPAPAAAPAPATVVEQPDPVWTPAASGAARAGGGDGTCTGSELRVAAVSSTSGPDPAARCR